LRVRNVGLQQLRLGELKMLGTADDTDDVHQRSSLANRTRFPSADSFGHVAFANCSLTTITGTASFVSPVEMSRPDFMGIFIVSK
jgi:hypothetical protein